MSAGRATRFRQAWGGLGEILLEILLEIPASAQRPPGSGRHCATRRAAPRRRAPGPADLSPADDDLVEAVRRRGHARAVDVAGDLGMRPSTVRGRMRRLVASGHLAASGATNDRRFRIAGAPEPKRPRRQEPGMGGARANTRARVLAALETLGTASPQETAVATGLEASTVGYHLRQLAAEGLARAVGATSSRRYTVLLEQGASTTGATPAPSPPAAPAEQSPSPGEQGPPGDEQGGLAGEQDPAADEQPPVDLGPVGPPAEEAPTPAAVPRARPARQRHHPPGWWGCRPDPALATRASAPAPPERPLDAQAAVEARAGSMSKRELLLGARRRRLAAGLEVGELTAAERRTLEVLAQLGGSATVWGFAQAFWPRRPPREMLGSARERLSVPTLGGLLELTQTPDGLTAQITPAGRARLAPAASTTSDPTTPPGKGDQPCP